MYLHPEELALRKGTEVAAEAFQMMIWLIGSLLGPICTYTIPLLLRDWPSVFLPARCLSLSQPQTVVGHLVRTSAYFAKRVIRKDGRAARLEKPRDSPSAAAMQGRCAGVAAGRMHGGTQMTIFLRKSRP